MTDSNNALLEQATYEAYKHYCSMCSDYDIDEENGNKQMSYKEFRQSMSINKIW